uniref:AP1 endonuclease n=1 Tax=Paracentrotus lividus TaxID=7656 RepID=Q8WPX3_PARLI|nr:AP1 endonuclease [Paracentrotus lividus]
MNSSVISKPILPVAGVHRSSADDRSTGRPATGSRQNDDGPLNPPGRGLSENSARSEALLRCRKPFITATFNANTAREEVRASEIAHCFESCGIKILGIQEHRRVHEDPVVFSRLEGQYLITASAWRNQSQASVGGVGLLLSTRARKALRRATRHSDRILVAEFDSNPVTTVIVTYSPTNTSPEEVVENYYDDLSDVIRGVPAHNFLAVLGDFNARLGTEDASFTWHDKTNRNGELLAEIMTEHSLLPANTQFRKKQGKRWTYLDRGTGMKRQLDYILVRRKWWNSILNAEPYNTFCTVGSDHRVVSMRVRLSLRVPKQNSEQSLTGINSL